MKSKKVKLLSLLMCLFVAFVYMIPGQVFAAGGELSDGTQAAEAVESPAGDDGSNLRAVPDGTTVLAFTSDVHNGTQLNGSGEANLGSNRLKAWLEDVQPLYDNKIEVMGFCGDMGAMSANGDAFWTYVQTVMNTVSSKGLTGVYTVGNHEYMNGSYTGTGEGTQSHYTLNGVGRSVESENYHLYCFGSMSQSQNYSSTQIGSLSTYLNSVNDGKPIIVITHFPLHYYSGRNISGASSVIDAVNTAVAGKDGEYGTSDDRKIIFLWGHNHTVADSHYDHIYLPDDTINPTSSSSSKIHFYYAAAGSMSDKEYGQSGDVLGKGLILEITSDYKLSFSYYTKEGDKLKTKGSYYTEKDPVGIESMTITADSSTVEEGRTLQLGYTTVPSDATVKSITWSSSSSAATVDDNGKVKGVTAGGTATITATISDGISKGTASATYNVTVVPRTSSGNVYQLTDELEDGEEYLIVNTSAEGSAFALKNPGGSSSGVNIANTNYKTEVTIQGDEIETEDEDIVWTATAVSGGFELTNDGDYLEGSSSAVSVFNPQKNAGRYWTYNSSHYLQHKGGSSTYNLRYSSSNAYFQGSTSSTGAVYLFKREGAQTAPTSISLDKTSLSLAAGDTDTLTVSATPTNASKKVTWEVNPSGVVSVENGLVTALAAGTATITARSVVDTNVTATCNVTVSAAQTYDYVLTDTMEAGKEYLISTSNNGSGFILSNETGSVSNSLKGYAVNVQNSKITITSAVKAKTLFTASGSNDNSVRLMIGSQYLYADGSGALRMVSSISDANKFWHYKAYDNGTDKHLLWFYNGNTEDYGYTATGSYKYYLEYDSNGNFTKGIADNNTAIKNVDTPKIYLFVRDTGTQTQVDVTGITLNKSTLSLSQGKSETLTATIAPSDATNKAVNWSSSDPSAVSVDANGKVTGLIAGRTATITAASAQFPDIKATCEVTVTESTATVYQLTDSLVDGGEYLIVNTTTAGSAYALKNPGGNADGVQITSSNGRTSVTIVGDTIETEDTDIVWTATAHSSGFDLSNSGSYLEGFYSNGEQLRVFNPRKYDDRYWTYSSSSQLQHNGGTSAYTVRYASSTFSVTRTSGNTEKVYLFQKVTSQEPPTSIALNKTSLTMTTGDTDTLTVTPTPSTASNSVTWEVSPEGVVTVVNGLVTAVQAGYATITARSTVNPDAVATCSVAVSDPDPGAQVTYTLTDKLESGKEYLIASGNTGSVFIVSTEASGSGNSAGLQGVAASVVDNSITITQSVADSTAFTCELESSGDQNSTWLTNGGKYLYANNSGALRMESKSETAEKHWHYKGDNKHLLWFFKDSADTSTLGYSYSGSNSTYRYYLVYDSNGKFTKGTSTTTSLEDTDTPAIYLFVKDEGTPQPHTHTAGQAVRENEVPATCEAAGSYDEVVYCTVCGEEMSRIKHTVQATGHDWAFVDFTWTGSDESGYTAAVANYKCNNDEEHKNTVNASIRTTSTQATCEVGGSTVYTATVTAAASLDKTVHTANKTVTTEPLNHDWNDPTYQWSADNSTCTATRTCKRDSSHKETETVNAVAQSSGASCEGTGTVTYTATFENEAFETQTKSVDAAALGHDWDAPTYKWADDNSSVTATRVCKRDSSHKETETVKVTEVITKAATCEETGSKTLTARFENEAFEVQTKAVEIPALGHDWEAAVYDWADDYSSCTATRACKNDSAHNVIETVTTTSEVQAATCEKDGYILYTAAFNSPFKTQTEKVKTEDKLGHLYVFKDWTWADDNTYAIAKYKCVNDGCGKVQNVQVDAQVKTVDAQVGVEGSITYTVTISSSKSPDKKKHTDSKVVTIPALPQPAPAAKITNLNTDVKTSSNTIVLDYKSKNAVKYKIRYRVDGGSWKTIKTTEKKYTIKNIKTNAYYDIKVAGINKDGKQGKYTSLRRRYSGGIKFSAKSPSKGIVKVTAKAKTNLVGYQIRYNTNKTKTGAKSLKVKTTENLVKELELKSGTTYYVWVRPLMSRNGKTYIGVYDVKIKVTVK
ncbi:MAG: Ig-like domain-containing protein [Firmicutes bacterium]|nr:Ig-like domain-containing protein [Bacillota bacterium]